MVKTKLDILEEESDRINGTLKKIGSKSVNMKVKPEEFEPEDTSEEQQEHISELMRSGNKNRLQAIKSKKMQADLEEYQDEMMPPEEAPMEDDMQEASAAPPEEEAPAEAPPAAGGEQQAPSDMEVAQGLYAQLGQIKMALATLPLTQTPNAPRWIVIQDNLAKIMSDLEKIAANPMGMPIL